MMLKKKKKSASEYAQQYSQQIQQVQQQTSDAIPIERITKTLIWSSLGNKQYVLKTGTQEELEERPRIRFRYVYGKRYKPSAVTVQIVPTNRLSDEEVKEIVFKLATELPKYRISSLTISRLIQIIEYVKDTTFQCSRTALAHFLGMNSHDSVMRFYNDLRRVPGIVVDATNRGTTIDISGFVKGRRQY